MEDSRSHDGHLDAGLNDELTLTFSVSIMLRRVQAQSDRSLMIDPTAGSPQARHSAGSVRLKSLVCNFLGGSSRADARTSSGWFLPCVVSVLPHHSRRCHLTNDFTLEARTECLPRREVSKEISDRLARIFLRDKNGRRPVFADTKTFQTDPHWRDHSLFYEYFHGDTGAGLGASHQTVWTGIVAKLIQIVGTLDPQNFLEAGTGR